MWKERRNIQGKKTEFIATSFAVSHQHTNYNKIQQLLILKSSRKSEPKTRWQLYGHILND